MSEQPQLLDHPSPCMLPIIPKAQHLQQHKQPPVNSTIASEASGGNNSRLMSDHYYGEYLKLFRDNSIFRNQLSIIVREKEELRSRYRQLKVGVY